MLPDIFIPVNTWVDLYALTGIEQGKSLKVTLKSHFSTFAWEGDSPPPSEPDDHNGEPVQCWESIRNTDLSTGFWILSASMLLGDSQKSRLSVQEWLE